MSTHRRSRCCETYPSHGPTRDSVADTLGSTTGGECREGSAQSPLSVGDRPSRDDYSSREVVEAIIADAKHLDSLRHSFANRSDQSKCTEGHVITTVRTADSSDGSSLAELPPTPPRSPLKKVLHGMLAFLKFVGPGLMIAVAYVDPGNFATDISAGALYRFDLLVVVLVSNVFAVFLQALAIKFGTVTGMDLATAFRLYLPKWLNYVLYGLAEIGIIASDIAEVVGTAIALNLLIPQLPLVAGCVLSICEVMIIMFFYRPDGSMRALRSFEIGICLMLLGVLICFCVQLAMVPSTSIGAIFRGYLLSDALIQSKGLYLSCGILGATIMPHGLFLGSGTVQPRMKAFDIKQGNLRPEDTYDSSSAADDEKTVYQPSHAAIKHSLKYAILELVFSLAIVALFINSAILIVSASSLYENPDAHSLDIFGIHAILSTTLAPAAGTVFALALLLAALSAGVICTIAGQMVSEGALDWKMQPWLRRLITRAISIIPATIIAAAVGRQGLSAALNASQVVLSTVLPFITLPLIYLTSRDRYMTVHPHRARPTPDSEGSSGIEGTPIKMANSWPVIILSVIIWLVITFMNVANIVLMTIHA